MPIELIEPETPEHEPEYLIVSDATSQVIFSSSSREDLTTDPLAATQKLAGYIRESGGSVTVFKATKY
jgi:hypothetical protein